MAEAIGVNASGCSEEAAAVIQNIQVEEIQ
jgi:hypothetical protein